MKPLLTKYARVLPLLLLFAFTANAKSDSLTIVYEDFNKAKAAAAKENKLLLIDFYTTWCGPCKVMSRDLFDNEQNAAAVAKNFVVLKYNAEVDTVFSLSKKYHVNAYPTALVLNADGRVVAKKFGIKIDGNKMDVPDYMKFLDEAVSLQKRGNYIMGVSSEINLNFPQFYTDRFNRVKKDYSSYKDEYWKTVPKEDYMKEVPFCVLSYFGGTDSVDAYFLQYRDRFQKFYGDEDVNSITYNIVSKSFYDAVDKLDEAKFESSRIDAVKYLPEKEAESAINNYSIQFWKKQGAWKKIGDYAEGNRKTLYESDNMNTICWDIFEHCDDITEVKRAAVLMKEYNELKPSWATMDTYANLLFKAGEKDKAIVQMKRAIELGKKEGEDVTDSEKALAKFKEIRNR